MKLVLRCLYVCANTPNKLVMCLRKRIWVTRETYFLYSQDKSNNSEMNIRVWTLKSELVLIFHVCISAEF